MLHDDMMYTSYADVIHISRDDIIHICHMLVSYVHHGKRDNTLCDVTLYNIAYVM